MNSYRLLQPWLETVRQRLGLALCGFLLALLTAISGVALLGVSGWFITAAAVSVVAFDIFVPGAAIRAFALTRTVSRYFERVVNHDFILRIQQGWRVRLFTGLFGHPLHRIEQFKLAHVLQRLTQDLTTLDDLYIRILAPILLLALVSASLGLGLFWLLPELGWVVWLLAATFLAVHCWVMAPRLRGAAQSELTFSEDLRHHSLAFMHSKAELHAWKVLPHAVGELATVGDRLTRQQRRLRRQLWVLQHSVELFGMLAVITVFALALRGAFIGAFSVPLAVLAGLAVLAMQEYWVTLPQATLLWGKVLGAATRLKDMLGATATKPDEYPLHNITPYGGRPVGAPTIILRQVEFAHRQLPKSLSLTLSANQVTWLEGPSGSGKTSVLLALSGLLHVYKGLLEVTEGEQPIALGDLERTFMTQDNAILAQRVAANLRMARTDCKDDELWTALEYVEMADIVEALPYQLDTWLGDGGVGLSGGQQRRLALARTLLHAKDAHLVLLDEPFNGVGAAQAERIWHRIVPLLKGKTVVVVSHQPLPSNTVQQRIQL